MGWNWGGGGCITVIQLYYSDGGGGGFVTFLSKRGGLCNFLLFCIPECRESRFLRAWHKSFLGASPQTPWSLLYHVIIFSCPSSNQNGFQPKSLKAKNVALGNVCMCLLNKPQFKHPLSGGYGGPPPEIFWLLGLQMVHSSAILDHCTPIPLLPS